MRTIIDKNTLLEFRFYANFGIDTKVPFNIPGVAVTKEGTIYCSFKYIYCEDKP